VRFLDRHDAGRQLAAKLETYRSRSDATVLALPRGGVPVAFEIAQAIRTPLDVFLVRKLGTPGQRELAMGAIATGGIRVLNSEIVDALGISEATIDATAAEEEQELARRQQAYRGGRAPANVRHRIIILVDDGVATGSTMRAAIAALRTMQPARIIIAVPVAAPSVVDELRAEADEVACLITPKPFYAVSLWYESFPPVSDQEVRELLARETRPRSGQQRMLEHESTVHQDM
jgi:predicted phosphoribosyltransferase